MRFLSQPAGVRFSNKDMLIFLFPVIFEQLMMAGLGMADTFMVSARLGTTALAGVALVNRIDAFAKQFFLALAQGGSVIVAQYIGAQNKPKARKSLKNNLQIVVGVGIVFMLLMVLFKRQFISLFFGKAEKEVIEMSLTYFSVTAFSYPFVALYYGASSLFRVMGESKIPFVGAVTMMVVNLVLKYIFIFRINLGVTGAGLSTLIAMATVGIVMLARLTSSKNVVSLINITKPEIDFGMYRRILHISVPNAIEQGMFQLGALILAGLVSGLGEDAINADQIARNTIPMITSVSAGFNALMLMVIGQCMGASDIDEAVRYKKHILKLNHLFLVIVGAVFIMIAKPLISVFDVSELSEHWALNIAWMYALGSMLFYPRSFSTASALRGSGDTRFVMMVAGGSMFIFRIGFAYVCVFALGLGVLGIWVAMISDWVIRTIIFEGRFRRGKWKFNHVI